MSKGTITAVSLTGTRWSLAAYVQPERTLKACAFCKDKKNQDVKKDALLLKLALLPGRIFTVTCSEPFRTCLGCAA